MLVCLLLMSKQITIIEGVAIMGELGEYRMLPLVIALVAGFSGISLGKFLKKKYPQLWSGPAKAKKVDDAARDVEGGTADQVQNDK